MRRGACQPRCWFVCPLMEDAPSAGASPSQRYQQHLNTFLVPSAHRRCQWPECTLQGRNRHLHNMGRCACCIICTPVAASNGRNTMGDCTTSGLLGSSHLYCEDTSAAGRPNIGGSKQARCLEFLATALCIPAHCSPCDGDRRGMLVRYMPTAPENKCPSHYRPKQAAYSKPVAQS